MEFEVLSRRSLSNLHIINTIDYETQNSTIYYCYVPEGDSRFHNPYWKELDSESYSEDGKTIIIFDWDSIEVGEELMFLFRAELIELSSGFSLSLIVIIIVAVVGVAGIGAGIYFYRKKKIKKTKKT